MTVFTVGHSTRSLDELVRLLAAHDVGRLVDVRRWPASRHHPQFDAAALRAGLGAARVAYAPLPALGGFRQPRTGSPHVALRSAAFRGYADHMETAEFEAGLRALLATAAGGRTAVMCAEADPARCHRRLLADALVARGVTVLHIVEAGRLRPHALSRGARRDGGRVVYGGTTPTLFDDGRTG